MKIGCWEAFLSSLFLCKFRFGKVPDFFYKNTIILFILISSLGNNFYCYQKLKSKNNGLKNTVLLRKFKFSSINYFLGESKFSQKIFCLSSWISSLLWHQGLVLTVSLTVPLYVLSEGRLIYGIAKTKFYFLHFFVDENNHLANWNYAQVLLFRKKKHFCTMCTILLAYLLLHKWHNFFLQKINRFHKSLVFACREWKLKFS